MPGGDEVNGWGSRGRKGVEKEGGDFFYPALDPDLSGMVLISPGWPLKSIYFGPQLVRPGLQTDPGDTKRTTSHSLYHHFLLFLWKPIAPNLQ